MENWLISNTNTLVKVFITVIIIFSAIILITRISGLRTFAKMSSFDFASTIAIGSILASVIMNTDQSLAKGILALAGIIIFQTIFSLVVRKSEFFQRILTNRPMLLMRRGEILYDNLKQCNVSESNLIAKLREANVISLDEVLAVVLESTGDISVLHTDQDKELEDKLLKGVSE